MTTEKQPAPKPVKRSAAWIRARKTPPLLVMIATYDYPFARLAEEAGADLVLVGDSLGTVILGYDSTVPVTIDDIVHHARAARRGAPNTHIVADLPFLSAHLEPETTLRYAARLMQEGGADSVKIEGGAAIAPRIRALVAAGIPVMGHIGLTPQQTSVLGGFRVQGKSLDQARSIIADAHEIAAAGAYAVVLEAIPSELATVITHQVPIPTIGIGAGPDCNGQVLVGHDVLGLEQRMAPRFVRRYANLADETRNAFTAFANDVRAGEFPAAEHQYRMDPEAAAELQDMFGG